MSMVNPTGRPSTEECITACILSWVAGNYRDANAYAALAFARRDEADRAGGIDYGTLEGRRREYPSNPDEGEL